MKKTAALFLCTIALLSLGFSVRQNSAPAFTKSEKEAQSDTAYDEKRSVYTLRESGGMVIIEHGDEVFVTDIAVSAMRDYDRRLLFDGINADTMEEALMLLEDLGS